MYDQHLELVGSKFGTYCPFNNTTKIIFSPPKTYTNAFTQFITLSYALTWVVLQSNREKIKLNIKNKGFTKM